MIVLIAVFLACVLLVLHPYVTYPLSLLVVRRFRPKPLNPTLPAPTSFAIVCCVYNERKVIDQKIENMRAVRDALGDCQLLIHSDASSDGTNEVLQSVAGEFTISLAEGRTGKSAGMNRLLSMTDAEIVIYTDANVMIDPVAVRNLPRYFQDREVGCVTGHLLYQNAEESQTAKVGALYWKHEEWVKQLESDTGSVMGADGSLFAIRRELHRPTPADIIDDFFTSMSILCSGYRLVRGSGFHRLRARRQRPPGRVPPQGAHRLPRLQLPSPAVAEDRQARRPLGLQIPVAQISALAGRLFPRRRRGGIGGDRADRVRRSSVRGLSAPAGGWRPSWLTGSTCRS